MTTWSCRDCAAIYFIYDGYMAHRMLYRGKCK